MDSADWRIRDFWDWFQAHEAQIVASVSECDSFWLETNVTPRVRGLEPAGSHAPLNWEIGPGQVKEWRFALAPSTRENLSYTMHAVSLAPYSERWEWYAFKPPKPSSCCQQVRLRRADGTQIYVDASAWQYVLKRLEDARFDILLVAQRLPTLSDADKLRIARLLIEGIVGERVVIERFRHAYIATAAEVPHGVPKSELSSLSEHLKSLNRPGHGE